MAPWIFAVLLLLNIGLFAWGYQHEKSLEPPATPVPKGSFEIRLLDEPPDEPEPQAKADDQDAHPRDSAKDEAQTVAPPDGEVTEPPAAEEPHLPGENLGGEKSDAPEPPVSDEPTPTKSESESDTSTSENEPSESVPEGVKSEASSEEPPAKDTDDSAPQEQQEPGEPEKAEVSKSVKDDAKAADGKETQADVAAGSDTPPAKPQQRRRSSPTRKAPATKAPTTRAKGFLIPLPADPDGEAVRIDDFLNAR